MKRILSLFVIITLISTTSFGQLKQFDSSSPNYKHDKMLEMVIQSDHVILPDSVVVYLKEFARKSGLQEANVMRNQALIRPIFNEKFSIEDRLWACRIGMEMSTSGGTMPVKIFNDRFTALKNMK